MPEAEPGVQIGAGPVAVTPSAYSQSMAEPVRIDWTHDEMGECVAEVGEPIRWQKINRKTGHPGLAQTGRTVVRIFKQGTSSSRGSPLTGGPTRSCAATRLESPTATRPRQARPEALSGVAAMSAQRQPPAVTADQHRSVDESESAGLAGF